MGKGGKTFSWFWIAGFSLVSLCANIASLVGDISPRTTALSLYLVNVTLLAEGLQNLAVQDGGQPGPTLLHPDLPTYWYWGMSGICDVYISRTKTDTQCRRRFPPTDDLLSIVEASVRDRSGGDPSGVVSAWNTTLSSLNPSRLGDKRGSFVSFTKASAALLVLAAIFDVFSPLVGLIVFGNNKSYFAPYAMPFFAAVFAIIAATLATLAIPQGEFGVARSGKNGGAGITIVFVGAAMRLGSSVMGICCCNGVEKDNDTWQPPPQPDYWVTPPQEHYGQPDRPPQQQQTPGAPDIATTGFEGEFFINNFFATRIPSWNPIASWTSHLRANAGIEPFTRNQRDFADFTYDDHDGAMRTALRTANVAIDPAWSNGTRFHVEVKATLGNGGADMFLRESQLQKMREYDHEPDNAYIIAHVVRAGDNNPRVEFLVNPWSLYRAGELEIDPQREDDDPGTRRARLVRYRRSSRL
ncbi:hypothetical protein C8A05DRAFT_20519 [Staphylotrichum tortipilum]|uniref:Protein NO VEIN C-terminal domain-containing protein n=1 Tax=Staphylotrichum tortipilum TaxID=2831512 RepID=A0AAN6M8S9_9PEZI|nr:hypothetical protein C8A05DRAFT_20519 [Staphylotrichum longicolle]